MEGLWIGVIALVYLLLDPSTNAVMPLGIHLTVAVKNAFAWSIE